MGTVVQSSKTLLNFGKTLQSLNLYGHSPAAVWRFPMGHIYPDQWMERAADVPKLPPGAYLIQARAGGVEKRTWLAITNVALLAKRSRQELLVYATEANSGKPIHGLALDFTDEHGTRSQGKTDQEGVLRVPTKGTQGNLWMYGNVQGSPAFSPHRRTGPSGAVRRLYRHRSAYLPPRPQSLVQSHHSAAV